MNYKHNTTMLPEPHLLRVCLSCWRRVPTVFARKLLHHRFPAANQLTCSGSCGTHWTRPFTAGAMLQSENMKEEKHDIAKNPFFEKYQEKLKHLQESNPQEFKAKVAEMDENKKQLNQRLEPPPPGPAQTPLTKPQIPGYKGPTSWPPKCLDEYMKVDLLQNLDTKAIDHIWKEHHLNKDCVFAVVPAASYDVMMAKSELSPNFLYTLPKGDGYEMYLGQFSGKNIFFTPLGMYQLVKENAPPCLSVAHFTELKEDKGIVLMAGEYDKKVISKAEAVNLVKQVTLYYGSNPEKHRLVRMFNVTPDKFQYMDVIEQYKKDKQELEHSPY